MLQYTGHPFPDIGLVAITAYVQKRQLDEVTLEDLDCVARYIEQNFVRSPLRGYLTMAFTSNAWFAQSAYNAEKPGLSAEKQAHRQQVRAIWAARHLRQWQDAMSEYPSSDTPADLIKTDSEHAEIEDLQEWCVFTGQGAIHRRLSGKLLPGRAGRAQIPLLQGDEAINFFPYGNSGLPISGLALLALQFFPLGCARCGIGLLAVHTDNKALLYQFTSMILQQNLRAVTEAQVANEEKLPRLSRSPKTLLVELLMELERQRSYREEDQEPASLTAYNFNNGKKLDLVIYHLPFEMVTFLQLVLTPTYKATWDQLVRQSWQTMELKEGKNSSPSKEGDREPRYNFLYEDLFNLPDQAPRFIRTYFLRFPRRTRILNDPRSTYSLHNEVDLVSWSLFKLFLERIIRMDTTRIEQIRALGDGFAVYVRRQGGRGKRFFRLFFTERNPADFRGLLIKANITHMKDGQPSLFDLDTYIDVFEEGYEVMRPDWRLARDLVLIRMIDQLKDWLTQNSDAIPDAISEEEDGQDDVATHEPLSTLS